MILQPLTLSDLLSLPTGKELKPEKIHSVSLDRLITHARVAGNTKIYQKKLSAHAEMLMEGALENG